MARRTLKACIGEQLIAVVEPGEGDCDAGDMILNFESGAFRILAVDCSEQGFANFPGLVIEETQRAK